MLIRRIRRTLVERELVEPGQHVVSACSGGPDSVAMTHALAQLQSELGFTLMVASVNHQLRPQAADEVRRVGELSASLNVPFHPLTVQVQDGASQQALARQARYDALLSLCDRLRAERLAVGHSMDDQAETVLHRILRGSGLDGLVAIVPRREDGVIRPLIDCRRRQVQDHIDHHSLWCIDDPSNRDPKYLRSRVRHQLLPALAEEDPQVVVHLAHLADDAQQMKSLLHDLAEELLAVARTSDDSLEFASVSAARPAVRRAAVARFLTEVVGEPPNRAQREAVEHLIRTKRGLVSLSRGLGVEKCTDRLVVRKCPPQRPQGSTRGGTTPHD